MIEIKYPKKPLVILTAPDEFDPWANDGPDAFISDIAIEIDKQVKKLPKGWKAEILYQ